MHPFVFWFYGMCRNVTFYKSPGNESLMQLLLRCYGFSLSDQYWMKPVDSELEWKNINFFENDFSDDVGNILFGQPASQDFDLMSPCNTSDEWVKKKWKIIDGKENFCNTDY